MKKIILILTLTLSLNLFADFEDGLDALDNGDYKTAYKEFLPLANNGDADAQYALGHMYLSGYGVLKDYKQAVYWYDKFAKQKKCRSTT